MHSNLALVPTPLPAVILDHSQEVQAHASGFARSTGVVANRPDHAGRYNTKLNYHEFVTENSEAAGSEIAVAQYMDIKNFIPTVDTFTEAADVTIGNLGFEVKWTRYINGHLIIHRDYNRLQDVAILVVGKSPVYQLAGWMPVLWAKKPKYYNAADGNFWVSQRELFEMSTLRKSVYGTPED
jgi:hypothetical protein